LGDKAKDITGKDPATKLVNYAGGANRGGLVNGKEN